jgi:hypothetical protein
MTKHTPGPWQVKTAINGDRGILSPGVGLLAECFTAIRSFDEKTDEVIANARLIAAAPELLQALENLVAKYDAMQDGNISAQLTNGDFFAARAAIAKAKGQAE